MELSATYQKISELRERIDILSTHLELEEKKDRLEEVRRELENPEIWTNPDKAQSLGKEKVQLENICNAFTHASSVLYDAKELLEMAEGENDEETVNGIVNDLNGIEASIASFEFKRMFSGEMDQNSAYLDIQSGSGGTEAQDWAEMLLRMYLRWVERRGFSRDIIDFQPGDEAGIKASTITVKGDYSYGLLLAEAGIHRLVRISPFDQAARRHTSFASVFVWPELSDDVDIEIEEKDLRIDTYRSSGAGGQHVNVTDSAVRITHLPTRIVVSCQNERSQHRNRDAAMSVLRARLYDLKQQEQRDKLEKIGGEKKEIAFGSQIRSYVLHPYKMVKDHRSGYQTSDSQAVLDGELDELLRAELMNLVGQDDAS